MIPSFSQDMPDPNCSLLTGLAGPLGIPPLEKKKSPFAFLAGARNGALD